jgi:ribonuclease HI
MNVVYLAELYCDGGVIGRNPSPAGGVYAWCLVFEGARIAEDVQHVTPEEIGVEAVSNNNSELLALLSGIEQLPDGWRGMVSSDSQVALGWVFLGWSQAKVPQVLADRLNRLRKSGKLRGIAWRLLQGHPTRADLERGVGAKRKLPVSAHNVYVDELCTAMARRVQS